MFASEHLVRNKILPPRADDRQVHASLKGHVDKVAVAAFMVPAHEDDVACRRRPVNTISGIFPAKRLNTAVYGAGAATGATARARAPSVWRSDTDDASPLRTGGSARGGARAPDDGDTQGTRGGVGVEEIPRA